VTAKIPSKLKQILTYVIPIYFMIVDVRLQKTREKKVRVTKMRILRWMGDIRDNI